MTEMRDKLTVITGTNWPQPIPLNEWQIPMYPTETLPTWLQTYVNATATATQTPPDLVAMMVLTVCAASLAKRVCIQVRPGWTEPLNLFTLTVLPPGNRKTAVVMPAKAPLKEHEELEAERLRPQIIASRTRRLIAEKTLERTLSQATKAKPEEQQDLFNQVERLAKELDGITIPASPRLLVDDVTPERLVSLLAEQAGRIAIISDEGKVADILTGLYSGSPDLDVFLKGHSGSDIVVERIGRPPESVKAPALTLGLAVQQDVLQTMAKKPSVRGRGLFGRFLFCLPSSLVGWRKTNPPPVPSAVREAYRLGVQRLLNLPFSKSALEPHVIKLDATADGEFQQFEEWLEPQLRPFGELGPIADWAAKLPGAVARVCGILHMAKHVADPIPWEIPVGQDTVVSAIRVARYLIPHAQAAFGTMNLDPLVGDARYVLDAIRDKKLPTLSRQQLWQWTRGRFPTVEPLNAALKILIENGYLREQQQVRETGKPGRPAGPTYLVNPFGLSSNP